MTKPTDKQIEARKKYSKSNSLHFGKNERCFGKSTEENRAARIKATNEVKANDYANNFVNGIYVHLCSTGAISGNRLNKLSEMNQLIDHGKILKH